MSIPVLYLRSRVQKTRTVTANPDLTFTIADNSGDWFRAQIFPARNPGGQPSDASPRSNTPRHLLWYAARDPFQPTQGLVAGDRVSDGTSEYEVLTDPIGRRAGVTILAWEVEVAPVTSVYPLLATLSDLGGTVVQDNIPLSLWEGSVSTAGRGSYDSLEAEAPAEFYNVLRIVNRELLVGSRPFTITSALLHRSSPHVRLSLRSKDV